MEREHARKLADPLGERGLDLKSQSVEFIEGYRKVSPVWIWYIGMEDGASRDGPDLVGDLILRQV